MPKIFLKERITLGWKKAISNFIRRRYVPVTAYCILTITIAFTFQQQASHNQKSQQALARNCIAFRNVLVSLLDQEIPSINRTVREHQITPKRGDEAKDAVYFDVAKVKSIQCKQIKP